MTPEFLMLGALWYLVFLLSTTCHEAAHAWAANLGGDDTAARGGQVSLNPVPHIQREMFGMVILPILMYWLADGAWMMGYASAPYALAWRIQYPRRAGWMALAGPGANLVLALLAMVAIVIGCHTGHLAPPAFDELGFARIVVSGAGGDFEGVATFLSILFSLNVILCSFNLLPVPPLDGATALGLFLPRRLAIRWTVVSLKPMYTWLGFLVVFIVYPRYLFLPVMQAALGVLYAFAG